VISLSTELPSHEGRFVLRHLTALLEVAAFVSTEEFVYYPHADMPAGSLFGMRMQITE
jgi:hypothetical protein